MKTVATELANYKLDFVAAGKVRWSEVSSQPAFEYRLTYGNENAKHH